MGRGSPAAAGPSSEPSLFLRTTAAMLGNSTRMCGPAQPDQDVPACSQTSCLLVVHVPWLHSAGTGHLWGSRIPSRAWTRRMRAGTESAPGPQGYGTRGPWEMWLWWSDSQSPGRGPGEAQSPVSWLWDVQGMGSPGWEQVGRDTQAAEENVGKWKDNLLFRVFRQVKLWFRDLSRDL